jgi:hypothetical protein
MSTKGGHPESGDGKRRNYTPAACETAYKKVSALSSPSNTAKRARFWSAARPDGGLAMAVASLGWCVHGDACAMVVLAAELFFSRFSRFRAQALERAHVLKTLELAGFSDKTVQLKSELASIGRNGEKDDFVRMLGGPQTEAFLEPWRMHQKAAAALRQPTKSSRDMDEKLRKFYHQQMISYVKSLPDSPEIAYKVLSENFADLCKGWAMEAEMEKALGVGGPPNAVAVPEPQRRRQREEEVENDEDDESKGKGEESEKAEVAQKGRKQKKHSGADAGALGPLFAEARSLSQTMKGGPESVPDVLESLDAAAGMNPAALKQALAMTRKLAEGQQRTLDVAAQLLAKLAALGEKVLVAPCLTGSASKHSRKDLGAYRPVMTQLAVEQSPFADSWTDDEGRAGEVVLKALVGEGVQVESRQLQRQMAHLRNWWSSLVHKWLASEVGAPFPDYKTRAESKGEWSSCATVSVFGC